MRSIDLDSLEIFRTVVQEGGVIRAANKLNRVQSNVTTRIKQLEQRIGRVLFRKQGRGLVLSPRGELLLSYAQRLFRLADEAENELRSGPRDGRVPHRRAGEHGRQPARAHPLALPPQHPGVVVGTRDRHDRRAAAARGQLRDRGRVRVGAVHAGTLDRARCSRRNWCWSPGKDVPAVRRAPDLAGMTLIAFANGCSYRKRVEDWLGASSIMPARTLEFASYQAMIACVAAGTGFADRPALAAGDAARGTGRAAARAAGEGAEEPHAPGVERYAVRRACAAAGTAGVGGDSLQKGPHALGRHVVQAPEMPQRALALEAGRTVQRRLVVGILLEPHHAGVVAQRRRVQRARRPNSATCGTPKAAATCIRPESLLTTWPAPRSARRLPSARCCPRGCGTARRLRPDRLAQLRFLARAEQQHRAIEQRRQAAEVRPALGRAELGAGRHHDVAAARRAVLAQHGLDLLRRQGQLRAVCSTPASPLSAE
jgi:DNA-binding transcriptional LysR family regulator